MATVLTPGMRVGRLTLVGRVSSDGRARWHTRCDCGGTKDVRADHLQTARIRSCGCFHDESARTHTVKHGHRRSRTGVTSAEYVTWTNIISRCADVDDVDYGGRGITVCARWRASFEAFFADMGPRPPKHSIDRSDVNGNYEPSNCRWATATQQARNTRLRKEIVVDGISRSLAEWAEHLGVDKRSLASRFAMGWTARDTMLTPMGERRGGRP